MAWVGGVIIKYASLNTYYWLQHTKLCFATMLRTKANHNLAQVAIKALDPNGLKIEGDGSTSLMIMEPMALHRL